MQADYWQWRRRATLREAGTGMPCPCGTAEFGETEVCPTGYSAAHNGVLHSSQAIST